MNSIQVSIPVSANVTFAEITHIPGTSVALKSIAIDPSGAVPPELLFFSVRAAHNNYTSTVRTPFMKADGTSAAVFPQFNKDAVPVFSPSNGVSVLPHIEPTPLKLINFTECGNMKTLELSFYTRNLVTKVDTLYDLAAAGARFVVQLTLNA